MLKRGLSKFVNNTEYQSNQSLLWALKNQHPAMYWWFAFSTLSLCSIYVVLLTKF